MKALLISGIYRPEIGGPANYLPKLADQLLGQGSNVEVVTLKNSAASPKSENWKVNYINRDQNILIRIIKTIILISKKTRNVDVVFANGLFQETAISLLFFKGKSVAKVVGDPVFERATNNGKTNLTRSEFNKTSLPFLQKLQRKFLRWSLNQFSVITCPSIELQNMINSWGVKKPIFLIANGVKQFKTKSSMKEFDVVSVSRLVKLKNIDRLIHACANNESRLAVIGSGPEEESLKKLANNLNAQVKFLGQLNEEEVAEVLAKSKIFTLISDYEGLSFALLSAMATGLASIVSNVPGNTDVISDGVEGLVIDQTDKTQLEKAIGKLLNSPELLLKFGEAAKLKVTRNYDQKSQIDKVINLMKVNS